MGLLFAIFAVAMAQNTSQNPQAKKNDASCCSMACCKGDSCPMKDAAAAKDAKDGCSCCSGDSCDMKAHDNMKNHAEDNAGCCCCSGDSCDMTTHENMKSHASGQECCCDEKHKNSKAKQKAA
jgi:hypothetical protein